MKKITLGIATLLIAMSSLAQQTSLNLNKELSFDNGVGINLIHDYIKTPDQTKYTYIKTKIPFANDMGMTSITLNYWGYWDSWETVVGFYCYDGRFFSPNAYTNGISKHDHVILFVESGYISIAVPNTAFSLYGSLTVHKKVSQIISAPDWEKNWDIEQNRDFPSGSRVNITPSDAKSTKNFAEQDLTFNANRSHNLNGKTLGLMNGNVGIGTTTPTARLHVKNGIVNIESGEGNGDPLLMFGTNTTNNYGQIGLEYNVGKGLNFWTPFGSQHGLRNNMLFIANQGNIGVGTSTPLHAIDVVHGAARLRLKSTGAQVIGEQVNENQPKLILETSNGTESFTIGTTWMGINGNVLRIAKDGVNGASMNMTNDKLILGEVTSTATNHPDAKIALTENTTIKTLAIGAEPKFAKISPNSSQLCALSVNGKAMFTEAEVALSTSWPDYVFANEYELPSLDSVATYINTHSHLPNVPSANEVSEKGINIAEMDGILLRKIEELTLYIIAQQKEIDAIKAASVK